MSLTHFPYGIASFGFPIFGSGTLMTIEAVRTDPAQVFFVSVNGSDGMDGLSPSTAFKTIAKAVSKCTTSLGSYIFLGEGRFFEQVIITQRGLHLIGMGPYRTQIQAPSGGSAVMTAFDGFYPLIVGIPQSGNGYAVEIAGMRVGGNGGYPGIYLGDGAVSANASSSCIHDCLIDGSNGEGTHGILLRGGSFIEIYNNLITEWLTSGINAASGATRTLYSNVIHDNDFVACRGNGIILTGVVNSMLIRNNTFTDNIAGALTNAIISTGGTGTNNVAAGNLFATAGTKINMKATDFASGNFHGSAGNTATFVTES